MIGQIMIMLQLAVGVGDFQIDSLDIPVGTAYHYRKSNIDGTSASNVLLYIASDKRIESLKWTAGEAAASLVTADMDWNRFSVVSMRNWRLRAHEGPELRGKLAGNPNSSTYQYEFGSNRGEATIKRFPWHSYDFDFSSLNITLRFLKNPEAGFSFNVADAIPVDDSWIFGEVGLVTATFLGTEIRHGYVCNRYRVDGPGLNNQGGFIWVSKDGAHIVDLEIALPDEDKYNDGKLLLLSVTEMSADEWQETIKSAWKQTEQLEHTTP